MIVGSPPYAHGVWFRSRFGMSLVLGQEAHRCLVEARIAVQSSPDRVGRKFPMNRPPAGLPPVINSYGHPGEVYQRGQALRDLVSLTIHQQDTARPAAPAPPAVIELLGPFHRLAVCPRNMGRRVFGSIMGAVQQRGVADEQELSSV